MIITIDGSAGTGKSTVAKKVAESLGYAHFDTGAMYRAVSLVLLQKNIPLDATEEIEKVLLDFPFRVELRGLEKRYFVADLDVTEEIRSEKVNAIVSLVAALPCVRKALWRVQRAFGETCDAVFEGRDLGTVVFPDAEIKIFLTACPEIRAERRLKEIKEKNLYKDKSIDKEALIRDMLKRDTLDSTRQLAPLKRPPDACEIDTSNLTIDQVVAKILDYKKKKQNVKPAWFKRSKGMSLLYRFILFLAWSFNKIFYRLKIYGLEHYFKGGAIIASNHTSFLDPPILSISWPEEVHFLARDTLFKNPLFGKFISALNAHPVSKDASDTKVFKTICALLNEGKKVILFPEGTRSLDNTLQEIKPGVAMLISRTETSIVPAYIFGAYDVWGRGRKGPKLFGKVGCIFGSAIHYKSFAHLDRKEAQKQITEALRSKISALKTWHEKGCKGTPPLNPSPQRVNLSLSSLWFLVSVVYLWLN